MTDQMTPLKSQEQFEELLKPIDSKGIPAAKAVVVYFTASWCGACKRIDFQKLLATIPVPIVWYKCDIDENKYTLGYCGLTKIPSFALIKDGKFLGKFTSSDIGLIFDMLEEAFS